jgi:hypothetical protein
LGVERAPVAAVDGAGYLSLNILYENSDSDVLVMQTADQGMRRDASDPLKWTREWRILGQRAVRSYGVVFYDFAQMLLAQSDDMVDALATD